MPDHLHALPTGYKLNEYRLERVLGSGGFGITYYARDEHLNKPVAIKEYLPSDFAVRADGTSVRPKSNGDAGDYQWGLERFLDEARALARFDHPHLNQVHRFFEAHGTAYLVLDYIDGETLGQMLNREGKLSEAPLRRLLGELLSGLEEVHRAGYVHRDVKPGNIMFRADGGAVLLDFGAARQVIGAKSKSITAILTPGYAPIEQYDQKADDVGAWSDLYALGMVAYRCVSGVGESGLIDAVTRSRLERKGELKKDMKPAAVVGKGRYAEALLAAIDWAIKIDETERPQSVAVMRSAIESAKAVGASEAAASGVREDEEAVKRYRKAAEQGDASGQIALGWMYANSRGLTKYEGKVSPHRNQAGTHIVLKADPDGKYSNSNVQELVDNATAFGKAQKPTLLLKSYTREDHIDEDDLYPIIKNSRYKSHPPYLVFESKGKRAEFNAKRDDAEAVKWFHKAANQGNVDAQRWLGWMYVVGRGVTKDDAEAVKWYRKAADQGNAQGQLFLGFNYHMVGVPPNYAEAVKWYRKAADQGNAEAQYYLGGMYQKGEGVTRNYAEAVKWYRKAADQGFAPAQNDLGRMYQFGEGVTQSKSAARKWYEKAAAQGHEYAKKVLKNL